MSNYITKYAWFYPGLLFDKPPINCRLKIYIDVSTGTFIKAEPYAG